MVVKLICRELLLLLLCVSARFGQIVYARPQLLGPLRRIKVTELSFIRASDGATNLNGQSRCLLDSAPPHESTLSPQEISNFRGQSYIYLSNAHIGLCGIT